MFTVDEEIALLEKLLKTDTARISEDGQSIERLKLGFWAPVWVRDDEKGQLTPWGNGKLTLEGEELLYRYAIEDAKRRRQPLRWY